MSLPFQSISYYCKHSELHYGDVIMGAMASQITSLRIVYSAVSPGVDQKKHQSSASLAFVRGTHRSPVNSPYKGSVTRKMFPIDDVIVNWRYIPFTVLWLCWHRSIREILQILLIQAVVIVSTAIYTAVPTEYCSHVTWTSSLGCVERRKWWCEGVQEYQGPFY